MPKEIRSHEVAWLTPPHDEHHPVDYRYFEDALAHPFDEHVRAFSLTHACWLADAALLAYSDPDVVAARFRAVGMQLTTFARAETRCYVAHDARKAFVIFRGTPLLNSNASEPRELPAREIMYDWLADGHVEMAIDDEGRGTHRGVRDALDALWPDVEPHLLRLADENPERALWFTGHGLGAALATLAADRTGGDATLYTFGSPRVGDHAFATAFRAARSYRFVHARDAVATAPRFALYAEARGVERFEHVGQRFTLGDDGTIVARDPSVHERGDDRADVLGGFFRGVRITPPGLRSPMQIQRVVDHAPTFFASLPWNALGARGESAVVAEAAPSVAAPLESSAPVPGAGPGEGAPVVADAPGTSTPDEPARAEEPTAQETRAEPAGTAAPNALGSRRRGPDEPADLREGGQSRASALELERKAVRIRRAVIRRRQAQGTVNATGEFRTEPTPESSRAVAASWRTTMRRFLRALWPFGRRHVRPDDDVPCLDPEDALAPHERTDFEREADPRTSLAGLALSGGGIRSATFSLGVLQALGERNTLWIFDYLSTVSGGGFTGGWWSAWLSRPERAASARLFPHDERLEPDRYPAALLDDRNKPVGRPAHLPGTLGAATPLGSRDVVLEDPIHHLRIFANYLTPKTGGLSADTWRAVTVVTRNMILTWLILLPLLLAAMLMAQLYFAGNRELAFGFACSRPDSVVSDVRFAGGKEMFARRMYTDACDGAMRADSAGRPLFFSLIARDRAMGALTGGSISPVSADTMTHRAALSLDSLANAFAEWQDSRAVSAPLHRGVVRQRLEALADPGLAFLLVAVVLTVLWMLYGVGDLGATLLGFGLIVFALVIMFQAPADVQRDPTWLELRWVHYWRSPWRPASVAISLAFIAWWMSAPWLQAHWRAARRGDTAWRIPRDQVRNRILSWHARLGVTFTVLTVTLFAAGFGHELLWFLFEPQAGTVTDTVRRAGGWTAFALTVASGAFTFVRSLPTSRSPDGTEGATGRLTRLAFIAAPILATIALLVGAAGFGHWMLVHRAAWPHGALRASAATPATLALLIGAALAGAFAIFERHRAAADMPREVQLRRNVVLVVPVLIAVMGFVAGIRYGVPERWARVVDSLIVGATMAILAVRWFMIATNRRARLRDGSTRAHRIGRPAVELAVVLAVVAWWMLEFANHPVSTPQEELIHRIAQAGLVFALVLAAADMPLAGRDDSRSLGLGTAAALACAAQIILHYLPHAQISTALATEAVGWAGFLVAWTIGLGWMADPNLLSLHGFYKSRLVRAYLGASNTAERRSIDITDTAPDDDVLMSRLANHRRGAPVHVVNATLNLVGGGDLATAQRSAASFSMSSVVCGSARTGYHRTEEYMDGTLSLGTAVATSGAAVSPTMGTKSVSSALTLLLSLFNVRLGLWVPTPNRRRWREPQPRLWPFYVLRETLSQTHELGTYCYLTDGGHFDNTGLYSLVERGCLYAVVLDDGADARPSFSDMGEVVRRCRIDFGAEIDFAPGVDEYFPDRRNGLVKVQSVRGTIHYARTHLRMLGWTDAEIDQQSAGHPDFVEGVLLWVRPGVTKIDSVDVRQYKLENRVFPQQTTSDQWYDESQFESYRALGYQVMSRRLEGKVPRDLDDIDRFFRTL